MEIVVRNQKLALMVLPSNCTSNNEKTAPATRLPALFQFYHYPVSATVTLPVYNVAYNALRLRAGAGACVFGHTVYKSAIRATLLVLGKWRESDLVVLNFDIVYLVAKLVYGSRSSWTTWKNAEQK